MVATMLTPTKTEVDGGGHGHPPSPVTCPNVARTECSRTFGHDGSHRVFLHGIWFVWDEDGLLRPEGR